MTLVYSTETGRIKPEKTKEERPKGDGIARIQRQTSGRKGKGVLHYHRVRFRRY